MDLSGGGSVTVGPMGRVNTNDDGATRAFKVSGGTYQVAVYADGTALTQDDVKKALLTRHSRNQRYVVFYRFFSLSSVRPLR